MYSKHIPPAHIWKKKDVCYGTIQQDENKRSVKFPCRLLANKEKKIRCSFKFWIIFFSFLLVIKNCKYSKGHLYLTTYVFWILFFLLFHLGTVPFTVIWFIMSRYNAWQVLVIEGGIHGWEQKHVPPHTVWYKRMSLFLRMVFLCACRIYDNVNITSFFPLKERSFIIFIHNIFASINLNATLFLFVLTFIYYLKPPPLRFIILFFFHSYI